MGVGLETILGLVTGKCPINGKTDECSLIKELRDLQNELRTESKLHIDTVITNLQTLSDSSTSYNMRALYWKLINILEEDGHEEDIKMLSNLLVNAIDAKELDKLMIDHRQALEKRIKKIKRQLDIE